MEKFHIMWCLFLGLVMFGPLLLFIPFTSTPPQWKEFYYVDDVVLSGGKKFYPVVYTSYLVDSFSDIPDDDIIEYCDSLEEADVLKDKLNSELRKR